MVKNWKLLGNTLVEGKIPKSVRYNQRDWFITSNHTKRVFFPMVVIHEGAASSSINHYPMWQQTKNGVEVKYTHWGPRSTTPVIQSSAVAHVTSTICRWSFKMLTQGGITRHQPVLWGNCLTSQSSCLMTLTTGTWALQLRMNKHRMMRSPLPMRQSMRKVPLPRLPI